MAFPRVNMASYQFYVLGGRDHVLQFLYSRRGSASRMDFVSTASGVDPNRRPDILIIGMVFLISSSLLGAVNFIATVIQLRALE